MADELHTATFTWCVRFLYAATAAHRASRPSTDAQTVILTGTFDNVS